LKEDILNDKLFGFIQVDIETPENLKEYFSEMTPIFKNAEINFIGDLAQKTDQEMLKTKNFGRKSLNEIKALLSEMDLTLGMKFENWMPPNVSRKEEEPES